MARRAQVKYNEEGLTALVFTSEGDMRQAVNNLQSTWSGFNFVGADEVFKVCDQPHPVKIEKLLTACVRGKVDPAMDALDELWTAGYSAVDIVVTLFRVNKGMDSLSEFIKLEFIRVSLSRGVGVPFFCRARTCPHASDSQPASSRSRARRRSGSRTCASSRASRPSSNSAGSSRASANSA